MGKGQARGLGQGRHSPCISPPRLVNWELSRPGEGCQEAPPFNRRAWRTERKNRAAMKTYPIFAVLQGKDCLVVGGGAVGERKVADLLAAGAKVTVVSPTLTPALGALAVRGEIRHRNETFAPRHLKGMALVLGATDDPRVNAEISTAARASGVWVNIADAPELCTFIVPAQVRRGDLTVAISTGGASPALARKLRLELEGLFGPEYGPYLALLQGVRARLLAARRGHPENPALFRRLVESPLREALGQGDREAVRRLLTEILGPALSPPGVTALVEECFQEIEAADGGSKTGA
jgi:precorrin-2 dehydrogenase/sirohydrochlorin ferrochelatase